MTLPSGTRLGPYEISSPLGAGGMGEVYRARDTRLDRTVALKVLPSHLAASPELRQRFEREAKAISALNHPHICVLHDIGRQDGIDFLVMEYLEGETLADRLKKGPLPLEQVLRYGVEIAEALDRAHRQGIVHRDLKPGNVMLTKSGTKLLDFGLAKLRPPHAHPLTASEFSSGPTEEKPLTAEGSIVGTLQYMAPEQLEGKEPDARTDIFALGTVLYEVATGKRAFTAKSQASLIAAILGSEPAPISSLQPLTPPALDRVVATCLAKDPDERWQNAHDLASELRWIAEGGSQAGVPAAAARRQSRERLAWTTAAVACALLGTALAFAVAHRRESPERPLQARFQIPPPEKATFSGWGLAVSPDGERVAFSASVDGTSHMYVRPLNSLTAMRLPGADGGSWPFWSPDGGQIGFVADGKLKRVDLSGGPAQTLCNATEMNFSGGSWSQEGIIVFSDNGDLFRIPAGGGEPMSLRKGAERQTDHFWPQFLPDGRRYLYLSLGGHPENQGIYVASLDSDEPKRIVASDYNAAYSPSGHLLFMRGDALMAQAFDLKRLELSGEPFPVSERVVLVKLSEAERRFGRPLQVTEHVALVRGPFPVAAYSVSPNGVLAWRMGSATEEGLQFTWFDRSGKRLGTLGEPADYSNPALSPDDRSLAVGRRDLQKGTRDLWLFDVVRGTSRRLTFDPADDLNPTWSPDGTRIAFTSDRRGVRENYQKLANGSGEDELLVESKDGVGGVEDWSADGKFLLYSYWPRGKPPDLYLLPLSSEGERKPIPFLVTDSVEDMSQFAPNGRWIAYRSNESGRSEVYVRGFSPDGASGRGKWQVSTGGGVEPRWRRDGKELFYLSGSTFMAVDVRTDGVSFESGIPKPLFEGRLPEERRNRYVVARDGQRFLVNTVMEQTSAAPIQVLVNWLPTNR